MVDFVLEDVAGYIEKKQEARCRQQCGKRLKSQLKLTVDNLTLFGGLMTDLGLKKRKNGASTFVKAPFFMHDYFYQIYLP